MLQNLLKERINDNIKTLLTEQKGKIENRSRNREVGTY